MSLASFAGWRSRGSHDPRVRPPVLAAAFGLGLVPAGEGLFGEPFRPVDGSSGDRIAGFTTGRHPDGTAPWPFSETERLLPMIAGGALELRVNKVRVEPTPIYRAALAARRRSVRIHSVYPFGCVRPLKTRSQAAWKAGPSKSGAMAR